MKNPLKWGAAIVLLSLFSCSKVDEIGFGDRVTEPGVYGYLIPIVDDGVADTKASVEPDNNWKYVWEEGDKINIWSNVGTLLVYSVVDVEDNRARFSGGGFTLTEGETYYSSHPLIRSVLDDFNSLTTTYEGEVQSANNDARHLAEYTYTYSSSTCTNGNTSFQYHHLSSFLRLIVTLPEALQLTELTVTAVDDIFALNGTADMTSGAFTPGEMSNKMTLKLNDIQVDDKVLKAFMAVAPFAGGDLVVRVMDSEGKVYTSGVVSKGAVEAGHATRVEVEVFEGENPVAAKIGDETYASLAEAIAAVPADGTETTITMIGNETITGNAGVSIASAKNIVLDLNGKTITGVFENPTTAQAITNLGTLTIMDSSTGENGTITIEVSDENAGSPMDKNWASNVIRNEGTLIVNSGNIVNVGNGAGCYAIDNYGSASLTVNGGKVNAMRASAIRMFYMNGGSVTVNGGEIGSSSTYMGLQVQGIGTNGITVDLTGGTFSGSYGFYVGGGTAWATSQFNISGGVFENGAGFTGTVSADNIDVTGGEYHTYLISYGTEQFIKGGTFTESAKDSSIPYTAEGYKFVQDGDMYSVVPNSDPREAIPANIVYYYWLNGDGSKDGGLYSFYAPFEGPDPVLMDGEFVELRGNVKLTKDVTYLEECSFGDPISKGGTFSLFFGSYSIDLNGYKFPLPTGVSVKTDKQTDIFSAAEAGYDVVETVISDGDYHYQYTAVNCVAQIDGVNYASLADAIAAVPADGTVKTIKLLADETLVGNSGVAIAANQNIVIDLNGQTVTLNVTEDKASQLITNRGTLTIVDNGDGNGKLTHELADGVHAGAYPDYNYSTSVIVNNGTINLESGTIESGNMTGSIIYAVDNNSTSYDAVLNVTGGKILGQGTLVRQFCNSTTKQNVVNVSGGTIETTGYAAIWTQLPGSSASSKKLATLNIEGGVVKAATYAWYDYSYGDSFEAVQYSISGGEVYGYLYSYAVANGVKPGFITGGLFSKDASSLCAEGQTCAYDESLGMYSVAPADVYYYWFNSDGSRAGGYYKFYAPFDGSSDAILMDGEFIELLKDITLTKDVSYIETCSWGDPIFVGGTFGLTFGGYNINLNGFKFPLPTGVSVMTDKQTNIFSAAEAGCEVVETVISEGDFKYQYSVVSSVAQIDGVKYATLADAMAAVPTNGTQTTITLVGNAAGNGVRAEAGQNVVIDFGGYTYTVDGSLVGSSGSQTQAMQLLKGSTVTLRNGTLVSTKASMIIQNYCDLTLEDMVIDGSGSPSCSYVVSNNKGHVNIIGSTSITAGTGKNAFDVCWAPNNGYPEGAQVTVNTTGVITGSIEYDLWGSNAAPVLSTLDIVAGNFVNYSVVLVGTDEFKATAEDNIQIKGGKFDADPSEYVAAGYSVAVGADNKYTVTKD